MADKNDPIGYAKYVRNLPSTERLLRQFLKVESSMDKRAYNRGYAFSFEFTQEQRDKVNGLMATGMNFEEAFDYYVALPPHQADLPDTRCPLHSAAWGCRCEKESGHEGMCVNGGDGFYGSLPESQR